MRLPRTYFLWTRATFATHLESSHDFSFELESDRLAEFGRDVGGDVLGDQVVLHLRDDRVDVGPGQRLRSDERGQRGPDSATAGSGTAALLLGGLEVGEIEVD